MIRIGILIFALASIGTPAPRASSQATTRGPLLSYLRVGTTRLAFEADTLAENGRTVAMAQSTFEDASRTLKPVIVNLKGDAGDALRWVCFRLTGSPEMTLILESDEMGGGNRLGGFAFIPARSRPELERKCVTINVLPTTVATNMGLRLGLTRGEVANTLGVAGRDSADVVIFERTTKRTSRAADGTFTPYTEAAWFVVRFRSSRVVAFTGWRVDAS
jgi:hypothetical protein